MNKKAMAMSTIALAILVFIIGLLIIFFISNSMNDGEQYTDRKLCEKSIDASSNKLREEMNGLFDPHGNSVKLECSTEYINYKEKDPEKIKRIIANKMYDCWDMYGEGEKEIFETKDGAFCAVCSRLTFKKEVEVNDFLLYLRDTDIPNKPIKYWEYFMGSEVKKFRTEYYENTELEKYDKFSTSEPIAIVYYMNKDAFPGITGDLLENFQSTKKVQAIKGGGVGIATGLVGGVIACVAGAPVCGAAGIFIAATTVGGFLIGTGGGYTIGSDRSADWDARILLTGYENLDKLECTRLESKSTPLDVIQK
ncbi:MAG: hypothetical protein MAG795_01004 [Candidatus Woesearchaeota archaeon]|nr:hypothetical protein [Candidatus Woesearchaeota archaeon]